MSRLPALRRGDCGHYIPAKAEPTGIDHVRGERLFLCDACRAALKQPKIERKA